MTNARRILTWKYEDGDGGAETDVGPAWISGAGRAPEEVNDGNWLTREQARTFAEQHGLNFFEDDGREDPTTPTTARPHAEAVIAINRKLRQLGIRRDDLDLSAGRRDDVVLQGAWYHRVADDALIPADNAFGFRTQGASMSLDEALAKIRRLVPEWDAEPDLQ